MTIQTGALCLLSVLGLMACGGGDGNTAANIAPVAEAGPAQTAATGSTVRLDGSGSIDANGDPLTYFWTLQESPAGSGAVLSDAAAVAPTFTADGDGSYVFRLVVSDGRSESAPDLVTVTATTADLVPVANAGADRQVLTGSTVTLDGSGSGGKNQTLTYAWALHSRPPDSSAVLSNPAAAEPTFTADRDGVYILTLVVGNGLLTSAPDTVTVTAATADIAVTIGQFGAGIEGTEAKWWGGVRGPDDKIYGIPYAAEEILVIDPAGEKALRGTLGAHLAGAGKWASGCLGPDGKIYAVPYNAPDVLIIDPAAGTAVRTNYGLDLTDSAKWAGAVLGADQKIYCIPRNATDILIIDPANGTAIRTTLGADLSGASKWSGGILASNGKIYGVPRASADILIIDPAAGTAERSRMGAALTESHRFAEGILAPDGKIYAIPYTDSPAILIIDPAAGSATLSTMGANLAGSGWSEAILGPDGKIYAVPYTAADLLIIDTAGGTASRRSINGVEQTATGKWVMGDMVGDTFFGIPYGAEEIIRVKFTAGE